MRGRYRESGKDKWASSRLQATYAGGEYGQKLFISTGGLRILEDVSEVVTWVAQTLLVKTEDW